MTLVALAPAVRALAEAMREGGVARLRVGEVELVMVDDTYPDFEGEEGVDDDDDCSHPPALRIGNACRACGAYVGPLRPEDLKREN